MILIRIMGYINKDSLFRAIEFVENNNINAEISYVDANSYGDFVEYTIKWSVKKPLKLIGGGDLHTNDDDFHFKRGENQNND
jgi:hypothetical protein